MTLTASEVALLKSSLGCWEIAGYICTGVVFIGCVGEFIAEFTSIPNNKDCASKVARLSLIVLILGIAGEILTAVRTSQLSGQIIAYVEQEAGDAARSAKTAHDESSTAKTMADAAKLSAEGALTRAGTAEKSLGRAETEAVNAHTAASSALSLAKGAREEADSFEQKIRAAQSDLAVLQGVVSARHIFSDKLPDFVEEVKKLRLTGKPIFLTSAAGDAESWSFCKFLELAFNKAEMKPTAGCGAVAGGSFPAGVFINGPNPSESQALANALAGLTGVLFIVPPSNPQTDSYELRIFIGPKYPVWVGR